DHSPVAASGAGSAPVRGRSATVAGSRCVAPRTAGAGAASAVGPVAPAGAAAVPAAVPNAAAPPGRSLTWPSGLPSEGVSTTSVRSAPLVSVSLTTQVVPAGTPVTSRVAPAASVNVESSGWWLQ